jgi:outer membrane lipoprotein SlyB
MKMIKILAIAGLAFMSSLSLTGCQTDPYNSGSYSEAVVYRGTVIDVREVVQEHQNTGGGAVLGAIAGGLVGSTIGRGGGNVLATVGGAVAGGFAGNAIENNTAPKIRAMITIRTFDGRVLTFEQKYTSLRVGDRVQVTQQGNNYQVVVLAY